MFNNIFFRQSCFLGDKSENIVEPDRPQMTIWHMRSAYWIPKATNFAIKCLEAGNAERSSCDIYYGCITVTASRTEKNHEVRITVVQDFPYYSQRWFWFLRVRIFLVTLIISWVLYLVWCSSNFFSTVTLSTPYTTFNSIEMTFIIVALGFVRMENRIFVISKSTEEAVKVNPYYRRYTY
jgi:hypothetical protein